MGEPRLLPGPGKALRQSQMCAAGNRLVLEELRSSWLGSLIASVRAG